MNNSAASARNRLDAALSAQRERQRLIDEGNSEGKLAAEKVRKTPREYVLPAHTWDDLKSLEDKHEELRMSFDVARQELITAWHSLDTAKDEDKRAFADALRNSKKDPGNVREIHARKCIEGLERRLDALVLAMDSVKEDIQINLRDKFTEHSADVERDYNAAVDKLLGSFRDWIAAAPSVDIGEVARLATLHDWVHRTGYTDKANDYREFGMVVNSALNSLNELSTVREPTIVSKPVKSDEELEAEEDKRKDEWNAETYRKFGSARAPHVEREDSLGRAIRVAAERGETVSVSDGKPRRNSVVVVRGKRPVKTLTEGEMLAAKLASEQSGE